MKKQFRIMRTHLNQNLRDKCPPSVDFRTVEPYEAQAQRNHGQTLQRLSDRGGLSPEELIAVMEGRSYFDLLESLRSKRMTDEYAVDRLLELLERI